MSVLFLLLTTVLLAMTVSARLIDLSHDHGPDTIMSPGIPHFNRNTTYYGDYLPGIFITGGVYFSGEHGGTHMDAPIHFKEGGQELHEVPLENTIAEGVMIDCAKEAAEDSNYGVPLKKLQDWEEEYGKIPNGAAIIFNFGWYHKYHNVRDYTGSDSDDQFTFTFPYISKEAAEWLYYERGAKIIGTDTMTPDPFSINGKKITDCPIHVLYLKTNRLIVENLRGTDRLPPRGFRFHAAPVKYVGNTGAQVRAYAMTFDEDMNNSASPINKIDSYVFLLFTSYSAGAWWIFFICSNYL